MVGDHVVLGCSLVVMQVLEAGCVSVSEEEGHESVAIIDSVDLLTLEELENVVLHDRVLGSSGTLSTGGLETDGVTKGEDVVEGVVLKSVLIDIDETFAVSKTGILNPLVSLGRRVDVSLEEVFLHDLTSVDVLESSDLLSVVGVFLDLEHFPSEHHFDSALMALVEGDLVSVGELVDLLVGGPVLDASVGRSATVERIKSLEMLVVGSVEVGTLALVGELRGVADRVTIKVLPAGVVVLADSFLVVEDMDEDVVLFGALRELLETLNVIHRVVEAGSQNKRLVVEGLTVGELEAVGIRVDLGEPGTDFSLGPVVDLGSNGVGHQFLILDVAVNAREVDLGADVDGLFTDNGHLEVHAV